MNNLTHIIEDKVNMAFLLSKDVQISNEFIVKNLNITQKRKIARWFLDEENNPIIQFDKKINEDTLNEFAKSKRKIKTSWNNRSE